MVTLNTAMFFTKKTTPHLPKVIDRITRAEDKNNEQQSPEVFILSEPADNVVQIKGPDRKDGKYSSKISRILDNNQIRICCGLLTFTILVGNMSDFVNVGVDGVGQDNVTGGLFYYAILTLIGISIAYIWFIIKHLFDGQEKRYRILFTVIVYSLINTIITVLVANFLYKKP